MFYSRLCLALNLGLNLIRPHQMFNEEQSANVIAVVKYGPMLVPIRKRMKNHIKYVANRLGPLKLWKI